MAVKSPLSCDMLCARDMQENRDMCVWIERFGHQQRNKEEPTNAKHKSELIMSVY